MVIFFKVIRIILEMAILLLFFTWMFLAVMPDIIEAVDEWLEKRNKRQ